MPSSALRSSPSAPVADAAAALFGKTRRQVLALLYGQPERSFYLREVAARAGGGMSQVQTELARLTAAGLVLREKRANQVHFRANRAAPIFNELQAIVTKTFGVAGVLRAALAAHARRIRHAAIYGSVAKGTATSRSDVDVLLVGDLVPSDLAAELFEAEQTLGRKVSVLAYDPGEFAARVRESDHFIAAVLSGPTIHLMGDPLPTPHLSHEPESQPARKPRARKAPRR
jgi:predicted nucleotidyltransferase